ncbi:hypothetical protein ACFL6C_14680 [Myxococcota bacterium]
MKADRKKIEVVLPSAGKAEAEKLEFEVGSSAPRLTSNQQKGFAALGLDLDGA